MKQDLKIFTSATKPHFKHLTSSMFSTSILITSNRSAFNFHPQITSIFHNLCSSCLNTKFQLTSPPHLFLDEKQKKNCWEENKNLSHSSCLSYFEATKVERRNYTSCYFPTNIAVTFSWKPTNPRKGRLDECSNGFFFTLKSLPWK